MRGETNRAKLERLMAAIGEHVSGSGVVYLTGGATALLFGWRQSTIDNATDGPRFGRYRPHPDARGGDDAD